MSTRSEGPSLLKMRSFSKPMIQAQMAGVSTPALAAAVSNAGGLGSLGVGAMKADAARKVIKETRALTRAPFNVNVFTHEPAVGNAAVEKAWLEWLTPHFGKQAGNPPEKLSEIYTSFVEDQAMLEVFLEEKPAVISFHFGLPSQKIISALKGAGITLFSSATNLTEAAAAVDAGVDALVAQGIEAGGHRGVFDTEAF